MSNCTQVPNLNYRISVLIENLHTGSEPQIQKSDLN